MQKILSATFFLIISFLIIPKPHTIASSNLEISTDANFSNLETEFDARQTIYVRATVESTGEEKSQLNLRGHNYGFIKSYDLRKINSNPNQFLASIAAPADPEYYSLEVKIESAGESSNLVRTIKVGNPTNASVKVNVNTNIQGQSIQTNTSYPSQSPVTDDKVLDEESENSAFDNLENQDIIYQDTILLGLKFILYKLIKNIWTVLWPFD